MQTEHVAEAEIAFENGRRIPKGALITIEWGPAWAGKHTVRVAGVAEPFEVSGKGAGKLIAGRTPTLGELEAWVSDSTCPTPSEDVVEPDGTGPDGLPSWLLLLGLI